MDQENQKEKKTKETADEAAYLQKQVYDGPLSAMEKEGRLKEYPSERKDKGGG
ncbi:hypothetical protein [Salinithrix halophila]|uniref:YfhE-like protein n=1 Tax=Salinithrix halophila TaxID=1485204 RepID=A0ABV8JIU4_9BACL